MNRIFNPLAKCFIYALLILQITSCVTAKKSLYFSDITTSNFSIDSVNREASRKVYPGDRILVQIVTADELGNKALNSLQKESSEQGDGILVDPSGYIEIPTIGKVYVKGQTSSVIKEEIKKRVDVLYRDATVYCTITGRVVILSSINQIGTGGAGAGAAGVISIPLRDERLTIPEVLSGIRSANLKLSKTWIIREIDGQRQITKLNLNSAEVLKSPFYYLRNNDVIYIEPNRFNQFIEANLPFRNLIGILAGFSGLALAVVLATK